METIETIDMPYHFVCYLLFELQFPLFVLKLFLWDTFVRLILTLVVVVVFAARFVISRVISRVRVLIITWKLEAALKRRAQMEAELRQMQANLRQMEVNQRHF